MPSQTAAVGDPLGRMMCHSGTYRAMAASTVQLARNLCGGRLVVCQEGGYSPTYSPFCALAVIETMAGLNSNVFDPWLGWYASIGGQALQAHQAQAIDAVLAARAIERRVPAATA